MDLCNTQSRTDHQQRIRYIDALRGFTMFLVVLQHIESFGLGIHPYNSVLGCILVSFRMPMFFFVSGYIAYKATICWDIKTYCVNLGRKAIVQLIPTIFFFSLFMFSKSTNPIIQFSHNGFDGYWFTFVLFEMFVIFYTLSFLCNKYIDCLLLIISVLCMCSLIFLRSDSDWWNILCLENLFKYFQFFSFGVLAKKYNSKFSFLIRNDIAKAFAILIFIICILLVTRTDLIMESFIAKSLIRDVIIRYAGLFVVFAFFVSKEKLFLKENGLNNCILYIGRRTLDIYLIHYFILPFFPQLTLFVQQNIISEILVSSVLSVLVIIISLLISEVIRSSELLSHYLLGTKSEKYKI